MTLIPPPLPAWFDPFVEQYGEKEVRRRLVDALGLRPATSLAEALGDPAEIAERLKDLPPPCKHPRSYMVGGVRGPGYYGGIQEVCPDCLMGMEPKAEPMEVAPSAELDIGGLVSQVRELAAAARNASQKWQSVLDEDGNPNLPDDERNVFLFLNGNVDIKDTAGRQGGGWGLRTGFYDKDKFLWRTGSRVEDFHVTHWMDQPPPPERKP